MEKINYLNVGCGLKFHPAWTNIDMVSKDPAVQAVNLIEGIPFQSNRFDVVYHSQVLEHIPKDKAPAFLSECFRVLRPGGVLRVVVPDLEEMATEYLRLLAMNLTDSSVQSAANYDWLLLEMYDQVVRNRTGGEMAAYLRQPSIPNEEYVVNRVGRVARDLIAQRQATPMRRNRSLAERLSQLTFSKLSTSLRNRLRAAFASEETKIGNFRLGGEVHMWMYDRFSLARLLRQAGFTEPTRVDPHTSAIPAWASFGLDVRSGDVVDPTSLFMEARKPQV